MQWEYGSIVAVQTGRKPTPIRVMQVNGRPWNSGRIWDEDSEPSGPDEVLNLLGAEGWELVSTIIALNGWDDASESEPPTHVGRTFVFYLKRPRTA